MTRWFGSGLVVIPNLFRDLGFGFKVFLLKPRPVGGVLYYAGIRADLEVKMMIPYKGQEMEV
jgi:hypothetical protein